MDESGRGAKLRPSIVLSSCVRVHNSVAMTELPYSSNCVELELAPIGSAYECETGTDAPSSGEFFRLPEQGGLPCPRSNLTSSNPSGNSS
jgi:hypothetical protein